jgi:hypothetical protein
MFTSQNGAPKRFVEAQHLKRNFTRAVPRTSCTPRDEFVLPENMSLVDEFKSRVDDRVADLLALVYEV